MVGIWLCTAWPAQAVTSPFYSAQETASGNLKPFPKWTNMLDRLEEQEKHEKEPCGRMRFNPCAINDLKKFLWNLRGKSLREQVDKVNEYHNRLPYITDPVNWGLPDYWATLNEFLAKDGDCEDYAIAKYTSLKALGVPIDKMRIVIVQDLNLGGIIHAILVVYDGDDMWVLDNQIKQVVNAGKIFHYRLIYAINESKWWAYHY